jgi:predicted GIY-YIG superfamily endonuclease
MQYTTNDEREEYEETSRGPAGYGFDAEYVAMALEGDSEIGRRTGLETEGRARPDDRRLDGEERRGEIGTSSPECAIYVLLNAEGSIFYVGQSVQPVKRLAEHQSRFGNEIKMRLIQNTFVAETPDQAEARWIRHYRDSGCRLRNATFMKNRAGRAAVSMDAGVMDSLNDERARIWKLEGKKLTFCEIIRRWAAGVEAHGAVKAKKAAKKK